MNQILKKINLYILLLIPIVLLVNYGGLFFPFISGKNFLFRFFVDIASIIFVFVSLNNRDFRPKKSWMVYGVMAFLAIVFVSDLLALNTSKAFFSNFERSEGFFSILHLCVYFFLLIYTLKESDWLKSFAVLVSVGISSALFGLVQMFGGAVINQGVVRLDSVFGNAAYFAGFMLIVFFINLILWNKKEVDVKFLSNIYLGSAVLFLFQYKYYVLDLNEGNTVSSNLAWGVTLFSLILVFVSRIVKNNKLLLILRHALFFFTEILFFFLCFKTQTRGALLGIIVGLIIGGIFILFSRISDVRDRILSWCLIGLVLISTGLFIMFKNSDFVKNDPTLSRLASISISETKTQARSIIWPMALEGFKERPVFGWGQEGFMYVFAKHFDPRLWRHEPWFDRTHNVFLDWLIASGLIGLISYLSLYVLAIINIFKISKTDYKTGAILAALISGYAFQNLFIFDNLASYIPFFLLLAYLENNTEENAKNKSSAEGVIKESNNLMSGILFVFIIIVFYISVFIPFKQNKLLMSAITSITRQPLTMTFDQLKEAVNIGSTGQSESAENLLQFSRQIVASPNVSEDIKKQIVIDTIDIYLNYIKEYSYDARSLISFGYFMANIGQLDQSIELFKKAEELSPKKQVILIQIGLLYFQLGKQSESLDYLKRAFELEKNNTIAGEYYSLALINFGHKDEAIGIVNNITNDGIAMDNFLADMFIEKGQYKFVIDSLKKVLITSPENQTALDSLFHSYLKVGDIASAKSLVSSLEKNDSLKALFDKFTQDLENIKD